MAWCNSAIWLVNCLAIIHLWPSYLWPSYLWPSAKKFTAVPGGNAHVVRPGYMSIDTNPRSLTLASMISLSRKTLERGLLDPGNCPTYRRVDMTWLLDGTWRLQSRKIFGWSKFLTLKSYRFTVCMYVCMHVCTYACYTCNQYIPVGTLSFSSLTNAPSSRPDSSTHCTRVSQVQGNEPFLLSSSLPTHLFKTARTNSSSLMCFFHSSLTVSLLLRSLCAKLTHFVDVCEVIHRMICSLSSERSLIFILIKSGMVGLGTECSEEQ